jgi:predicted ATPase
MTLFHQLQKLEISGLIRLVQEYPELEYLFRHALVQDAAYESLLLSDRKQMHSTVAQVLEQLFGEQLDEVAVVLGHHWQLAGRPQKALHYFVQAGDVAAKAYANDEAVAHYGRSLTLAQQTAADSDTLVHVCTALGRVLEIQSNYHKALTHYQDMSQLAEQINDQALALAALMGRTNLRVTATPVHDLILGESFGQQAMAIWLVVHRNSVEIALAVVPHISPK